MKKKFIKLCLLISLVFLDNLKGFAQAPTLGATYEGGTVGYILQAGDPGYDASLVKGLIVGPLNSLPITPWAIAPYLFNLTNVTSASFGTGAANTAALVNLMGPGDYMAYKIDTATINGYSDWYLPSQLETSKLLENRFYWVPGITPALNSDWYWTSTEVTNSPFVERAISMAYRVSAGQIVNSNTYKGTINPPLPVRSFSYNPCTATTSTSTITNCGSYTWNGTTYTSSGTYSTTLVNAGGCDSIATLNLTITQAPGCVTNGLKMWVKANQGFTYTTTANAAGWVDASGNGNDAKVMSGEPGTGAGNPGATINFNPAIDFDGSDDLYYFDYALSAGYSMFGVSKQYDFSTEYQRIFSDKISNFLMGNWNRYEDNLFMNGTPAELFITPQTTNVKLHDLIRQTDGAYSFKKNGLSVFSGASSDGTAIQPTLGGSGQFGEFAFAHIPEYIAYDTALTTTERQKVESYLAVKYGLTLGSQASPYNYLASDGSVIWTGNSTYYNNITVIGRDDNSALAQKQSTAVNGGKTTISLGNTIAADNASNTATFGADKRFLAIASNGASGSVAITGVTGPTRSAEVWKVSETNGDNGNVTIKVTESPVYQYLLVSTTENFTAGSVTEYALNSNKEVTVNLIDGSYFALGTNCILTRTINATACDQYTYNGTNYNTTGVYSVDTIYNASGCDSVIILNLTIKQSSVPSVTTVTNCNAYTWHGQSYINVGTYTWTGTNAAGCDSIEILNVVSNSALTLGQDFQGGKIGYILQPGDPGYDPAVTKGLIVGPKDLLTETNWATSQYWFVATGVTTDGLGVGADNTTALVNLMGPGNYIAYQIDTATINGYSDWYMPSGAEMQKVLSNWTYWHPVLVNTNTAVVGPYATSTEIPLEHYGVGYATNLGDVGLYIHQKMIATYRSLPVRSFSVTPVSASISTTTVATCGPYTWHGQTYNSVGTYTWTGTTTAGCDSIEILNLVTPASLTIGQTLQGGKIGYVLQPGDSGYDSTKIKGWILGPVQSNRPWAIGAAQTSLINITQNGVGKGAANTAALVNYMGPGNYMAYAIDTATYGGYSDWYMATIDELEKVFDASYTGGNPNLSFAGAYLGFGNKYYMGSADEYDANRVVIWEFSLLDIFLKSNSSNTASALPMRNFEFTIPSGTTTQVSCGSYLWNGNTYTTSGTYTSTLQTVLGCDSVATLNLTITSPPSQPTIACYETATLNTTTCSWNVTGTQPSAPTGLACYETATFNTTSCTWDVTGSPAAAIVTTTTDCQSYTWSANGTTYTQSGTYNYTTNCQDYTLNLTINSTTLFYADVDGDGYGNTASTTNSCNGAPIGYVSQAGDCDDNNANVNPAATEVCSNNIDDNCDGNTDEGSSFITNPISGNLQICNLFASAKKLTTTAVAGASNYIWTVPSDMTIDSGQGTTSIVLKWGNINVLPNGIVGNVTVTATGTTTGCGTLVPASIPVDIQHTAPVTPPSISGPKAVCPNDSGVYSISLVRRASSYEWSLPTGASVLSGAGSNIINVSYENGFAGGNITVGAKNVCGLSTPLRSRTVTLNVLPAPASITGPVDGLCNATNASYLASSVVGATGYNWTVPATGSINGGSTSNNISVNFNSSFASGNITVAAVNNCGVGATRSIAVKGTPAIPGAITGPATACTGSTQSYSISTVQGASNYIWTVPGGAVINSGQGTKNLNLNFGSVASANGIITVKSSNSCGTSTAKVLAVVTNICPRLGDATTQLEVYPNPANSFINLSFNVEQSQQATIILRDAAGRIVYNEGIDAIAGFNNQQIEVSNLAKGVYFVQLQTGDSSENTRLIVE